MPDRTATAGVDNFAESGNSNQTYTFASGTANAGDTFDGGGGTGDILLVTGGVVAFNTVTSLANFEILTFGASATALFSAVQFGGGLSSTATINGSAGSDALSIVSASSFSGAGLIFSGWGVGNDVVAIQGGAGADTITGTSQNDAIFGSTGADTLDGGDGDDVFTITEGDLASGETYTGGNGTDTMVLNGGGLFDLAGVTLATLEHIWLNSSLFTTTLKLASNSQAALVSNAIGSSDRVELATAVRADLWDNSGFATVKQLLDAGVEEVAWSDAAWIGDTVAVLNIDGSVTATATDTAGSQNWSTRATTFDASGNLVQETRTLDNGNTTQTDYVGGVKTAYSIFDTDNDVTWNSQVKTFHANGNLSSQTLNYDAGQPIVSTATSFDVNGVKTVNVATYLDGRVATTTFEAGVRSSFVVEDNGNAFAWASKSIIYDGAGNVASSSELYDNGGYIAKGGAGDDVVSGGNFNDTLWGLGGADDFAFAGGLDRIRDYSQAQGDQLDLTAFGVDSLASLQSVATLSDFGGGMRIDFGGGDIVRIDGLSVADLTDADFVGFGIV